MNTLYKTTLLTTMAVVTWKVIKAEKNDMHLHLYIIVYLSFRKA
ncbi:hypothetical protein SaO268_1053 [Staphylococcus aureus]|nr:hypothetical protein SaO268_1053 [Staphylococcus aureus]